MEQTPKTSFIPKQGPGLAPRRQHRTFNVLTFIATIIFIATLVLSVGVFFYHQYSVSQLEDKKTKLSELKETFSEGDIESIKELERRLNAAKTLLDQHIALSRFFDALEAQTQINTQIASFGYERLPSGTAQVEIEGKANSFNTVALQEQGFSGEKSFSQGSVIFSDLNVSEGDGKENVVTFKVAADLDTTAVAYLPSAVSLAEEVAALASSTNSGAEESAPPTNP